MFTKKTNILILSLIVVIGLITYLESSGPEEINWFPSYARTDKIPLGTYVSYHLIKNSFSKKGVKNIDQPPYEFLADQDTVSGTYMFVNGSVNFDDHELDKMMDWVDRGNTLFVSAKNISSNVLDTLGIEMDNLLYLDNSSTQPIVELTNTNLKGDTPYLYDQNTQNPYFKEIDTLKTKVLGIMQLYNDTLQIKEPNINYLEKSFGNGKVLLHSFPEAFSNYFILKDANYEYTQNLLAYVSPDQPILWDDHYKTGKKYYTSPLYFLLKNRYLKWAYYMLIIGTILFILFEGKRKQRSIPVIEPLKNQTLAFTRTISGMYFEKSRHKEIATKQNLLFLEYVRSVLRIPTDHMDQKTLIDIAARSNNTIEDTQRLFAYFDDLHKKVKIEKEELERLYELISEFKSRS